MHLEPLVTFANLALGTRQRVFLVCLGMQEDGEILAHRFVTQLDHLLGRGAHHNVVAVLDRQAQQFVADGAAYYVGFHAVIIYQNDCDSGCRRCGSGNCSSSRGPRTPWLPAGSGKRKGSPFRKHYPAAWKAGYRA